MRIFRLKILINKFRPYLFIFSLILINTDIKAHAGENWEYLTSINSNYINVLESTPFGILAGQLGSRIIPDEIPPNSVLMSKDFGRSWKNLGLANRGILDLKYYDGKIYAATYYTIDFSNGLFVTENFGKTWTNIWSGASPTKIDRDSETIYLGTKNYGVYISKDEGATWQKVWEGSGTSLQVNEIQSSEDVTLVGLTSGFYITRNKGTTWEKIEIFDGKTVGSICINDNVIFAGLTATSGLYRSKDLGLTWEKIQSFGNYSVDKIIFNDGVYYAGRYNPNIQKYSVYYSLDGGETWIDTGLNHSSLNKVGSMAILFSEPSALFASVTTNGVFKYKIPKYEPESYPFLNIPWEFTSENELIDNITSFFDHAYPLLGYSYFPEPESEKNTTLNFLGYKDTQPRIFYSSHSGFDFGLRYGTNIIAPAPGYATYYYCKDCGNSIKIDHGNGYQTTYMHLQNDNLITKDGRVWVNNNDIIGKVGLTGRTSGPHLHFEITKDNDLDGSFLNDFPTGRSDPFGWQVGAINDPWEYFSWDDSLGSHNGSSSTYLWNIQYEEAAEIITSDSDPEFDSTLVLGNKNIRFENINDFFTTKIFSYVKPIKELADKVTKYIEDTSFILESFNQLGNKIKNFVDPIKISVGVNFQNLQNINLQSLSLYSWNEITQVWEKIPSTVDLQNSSINASVNHLSWFAIFGDRLDSKPPETQISVSGQLENDWFTSFPLIEFSAQDNLSEVEFVTYSADNGDTWKTYTEPFLIEQDGIIEILYKSQDTYENMEDEKSYVLKINTSGFKTGCIKIKNTVFEVSY